MTPATPERPVTTQQLGAALWCVSLSTQIDRQTLWSQAVQQQGLQRDLQTDRQTVRQQGLQRDLQTDRQTDSETAGTPERPTDRQTDSVTAGTPERPVTTQQLGAAPWCVSLSTQTNAPEPSSATTGTPERPVSNKCIAVRKVATPLRELTCHMGSHSVTCHPAEVTFPPLPEPKLVLD